MYLEEVVGRVDQTVRLEAQPSEMLQTVAGGTKVCCLAHRQKHHLGRPPDTMQCIHTIQRLSILSRKTWYFLSDKRKQSI